MTRVAQYMDLTDFQLLTPGLHQGDDIKIRVNYRVECTHWLRHLGWVVYIESRLDGQMSHFRRLDAGNHGGRDNVELVFTGKMPVGKHLSGTVKFYGEMGPQFWREQHGNPKPAYITDDVFLFAERPIVIPNLTEDDEPPLPEPPVVCKEGDTKCEDYHLMECVNNRWAVKKYWAEECGWTPTPPPEPPEPPPPTPPGDPWVPPDIPGWFERNKHIIIPVAVAVVVIALIVIIVKTRPGFRSPVKGFRSPVYRRKR